MSHIQKLFNFKNWVFRSTFKALLQTSKTIVPGYGPSLNTLNAIFQTKALYGKWSEVVRQELFSVAFGLETNHVSPQNFISKIAGCSLDIRKQDGLTDRQAYIDRSKTEFCASLSECCIHTYTFVP